jgi:serine/threonine-protein kinase
MPEGAFKPRPVLLPPAGAIGADEAYVPAGWSIRGGDDKAINATVRGEVWLEGFVIQRDPVTQGQYLNFLNDLVRQGRQEEAERYLPQGDASLGGDSAPFIRDDKGPWFPRSGPAQLTLPVVLVDVLCATMYAWWLAGKTGHDWTLPDEDQWEKAARGVDGRAFPWGNAFDPTFACTREWGSYPVPTDHFPADESPYGVRGLGGNVRDWCKPFPHLRPDDDLGDDEELHYAVRGGSCVDGPADCRVATRHLAHPQWRSHYVGFRLVRPFPR